MKKRNSASLEIKTEEFILDDLCEKKTEKLNFKLSDSQKFDFDKEDDSHFDENLYILNSDQVQIKI